MECVASVPRRHAELSDRAWSSRAMTYEEVDGLLRRIIGLRKKYP